MPGIVGGVDPLAVDLGSDVSGKAHGAVFFANRVSAAFGADRDQQCGIFNLSGLRLSSRDSCKRESDQDWCDDAELYDFFHGWHCLSADNFPDFAVDEDHTCAILRTITFTFV